MSDTKLGQLLDDTATRDAIHVAIAPVIAGEDLEPGDHVRLDANGKAVIDNTNGIGIVDPFLRQRVGEGCRFYLCLYQQTVTGMRHHWTHPAFGNGDSAVARDPEGEKQRAVEESRRWLQGYADFINRTVNYVIEEATSPGGYIVADGVDQHGWEYDGGTEDDFWRHVETIVGHKISDARKSDYIFSCSC